MKALEITKEQKEKLVEICNFLWPEYRFTFHHLDEGQPDNKKSWNFLPGFIMAWEKYEDGEHSEYYGDVQIFIHWFEFCMTTLAEKVIAVYQINKDSEKVYSRMLNEDLSKFYLESLEFSRGFTKTHPVDYLYQQFKLLP